MDRLQDSCGPMSGVDIQQQRARTIAGLGSPFTGQPAPQMVLGQQDFLHSLPQFRLLLLKPAQGSRLEASCQWTASNFDQALSADQFGDLLYLRRRALVRPDHSRGKQLLLGIEQEGA